MRSRLDLQNIFETLLESRNVYYQPSETLKMQYPAIVYSKIKPDVKFADNEKYSKMKCYEVMVISSKMDHPVIEKIEDLPYSSWNRHYIINNLHHDVLTLYF